MSEFSEHKPRQRQDLTTTPAQLRSANDMRAKDNYNLMQLTFVRENKDPNESDTEESMTDTYEPPVYDAAMGAMGMKQHADEYDRVLKQRLNDLKIVRKSAEHKNRSEFEKMCHESSMWMHAASERKQQQKHQQHEQQQSATTSPRKDAAAAAATSATTTKPPNSPKRHAMSQLEEQRKFQSDEDESFENGDENGENGDENGESKKQKNNNNKEAEEAEIQLAKHEGKLRSSPGFLCGTLHDYQVDGVNWILQLHNTFRNGILADEMGLGKTFQTIAALACLKYIYHVPGPHLIIAPKSVLGNWYREVRKWCPALSCFRFHASSQYRKILIDANLKPPVKYDIVVTTYEMAVYEQRQFQKIKWNYLIVDEAHKLKSSEGQAHQTLASLSAYHRLLVTGTPLQNNLEELWALLNFLAPQLYDKSECFKQWFHAAEGKQNTSVIDNLHMILEPIMLRRLKMDVNTGIPPKREIYVACPIARLQRQWYLRVLARDSEQINRSGNKESLSNIVMQLRKAIAHPYLFPEADETHGYSTNEKIVRDCGKMVVLDKLLRKLHDDKEARHKVLLFSQFTSMLNIIEDYFNMRGYKYCRIDGGTSAFDRDMQMADFNNPESDKFIFMLSTRAGGLGINLQSANNVIIYDSDWNPSMDLQAMDRAHRIGQKREVRVFRLVTENSIEQRIYERALAKLYLDAAVVQQGRLAAKLEKQTNQHVSKEELQSMIRFGANEMFKTRNENEVTDADIDALLASGETKNTELQNKIKEEQQTSLASFKLGANQGSLYDFEGVNYNKDKRATPSKIIYFKKNAEETISDTELRDEFSSYGEVTKVTINSNLEDVLVTFKTLSSACAARSKSKRKELAYVTRETEIVSADLVKECWDSGTEGKKRKKHHGGGDGEDGAEGDEDLIDENDGQARELQLDPFQHAQLDQSEQGKRRRNALPKRPEVFWYQLFDVNRIMEIWAMECEIALRNVDTQILAETEATAAIADAKQQLATGNITEQQQQEEEQLLQEEQGEQQEQNVQNVQNENAAENNNNAITAAGFSSPSSSENLLQLKARLEELANRSPASAAAEASASVALEALPPGVQEEKERLMAEGFPNWIKKDFDKFRDAIIKGIHKEDFQAISEFMGGSQSAESVHAYGTGFWDYGHRVIPKFDQIEQRAKRFNAQATRAQAKVDSCRWKVEQYEHPMEELQFGNLTKNVEKAGTQPAWMDRQLFMMAYDQGMKADGIGEKLKNFPESHFDCYMQTRNDEFFEGRLKKLMTQTFDRFMEKDKPHGAAAASAAAGGEGGKTRRRKREKNQNQNEVENIQQPEPANPVEQDG